MSTFSVEMIGLTELIVRLDAAPEHIATSMAIAMNEEMQLLQTAVAERMASLFRNPTKMQDSLSNATVAESATTITGTVTAQGLPYLAIQEYGGTVQIPEIFPVDAAVLHFLDTRSLGFSGAFTAETGSDIFTAHTKAHPITLPERSFMRYALAQQKAQIVAHLQEAIQI